MSQRPSPARLAGIPPQIGVIDRRRGVAGGVYLPDDGLGAANAINGEIESAVVGIGERQRALGGLAYIQPRPVPCRTGRRASVHRIKIAGTAIAENRATRHHVTAR